MNSTRLRAYCFASGLIDFGPAIPDGALPIAQGRALPLRSFIEGVARRGYEIEDRGGRPTKIVGTDHLLVPGVSEWSDQSEKLDSLNRWLGWIAPLAPRGVEVCRRDVPAAIEDDLAGVATS